MPVSEILLSKLSSTHEAERHQALRELVQTCSAEDARPLLQGAAKDPSRVVRFLARDLLAAAGDTRVAQPGKHSDRHRPTAPKSRDASGLFFSFEGRIARSTFWTMTLLLAVVSWVIGAILLAIIGNPEVTLIVVALLDIPFIWATLAIQVKRWHDRDKSGWWILISLIPLFGGIWALVETGFLRGTVGPNRYGEDPCP